MRHNTEKIKDGDTSCLLNLIFIFIKIYLQLIYIRMDHFITKSRYAIQIFLYTISVSLFQNLVATAKTPDASQFILRISLADIK